MQSNTCIMNQESTDRTDSELIADALSGDQLGFEQLANRHKQRLLVSISLQVGCPAIAEDIVQEAFLKAFLHLNSFRKQSNFYTWLYRIALNSRRNYLCNLPAQLSSDAADQQPQQTGRRWSESPAEEALRSEERIEVRAAITRLDAKNREILILREFEGLDYQAIARRLGMNMGTVRSRLSRARAQLKQELVTYQVEA